MRKLVYAVVVGILLLSSCNRLDFNEFQTGQPYVGHYQGQTCVVIFDNVWQGGLNGRIYLDDDSPSVKPLGFVSDLGSKGDGRLVVVSTELELKKVSLKNGVIQGQVENVSFSLSLVPNEHLSFRPQYKAPCYDVAEEKGRVYARDVEGYWMRYPDTREDFATIYINKVSSLSSTKKLNLDMDLYYPKDTTCWKRPLLLLIHGGAFYNGDKQSMGYPEMGQHFAELGYVVASINYRLGFTPFPGDVDRAGYRALQDAHAAVCYLMDNADEFGIDTTMMFAAGTSAGAITALNLAFMHEEDRPATTKEGGVKGWMSEKCKKVLGLIDEGVSFVSGLFNRDWGFDMDKICKMLGLDSDLGPINAVAGSLDRPFKIKAVVNMWGAVHDLAMLSNSPETSILSFHGDADPIVPYQYGYPFDKVLEPYADDILTSLPSFLQGMALMAQKWVTQGKPLNEWAFSPMRGSKEIHDKVSSMKNWRGRNELHTLAGADTHSLHVDGGELTDYFHDTIIPNMTRFLYEEIVGGKTLQLVQNGMWFEAVDADNVADLHWQVEGGVVIDHQGDHKVKVLFFGDAKKHAVAACGRYRNGVEFREMSVD